MLVNFKDWVLRRKWWVLGVFGITAIILVVLSWWIGWDWVRGFWCWVVTGPNGRESGSTTIRNLGLVIGGLIALPLTLWRIWVADRQAKATQGQVETAQHQAEIAQHQAKTAQRRLMDERYQKATEMLVSDVLAVRLEGISALQDLAEEDPEQYHIKLMRRLGDFVRHPTKNKEADKEDQRKSLCEDIRAVMKVISNRSDTAIALEKKSNFKPDLQKADLCGGTFIRYNLSNVFLPGTNLADASLAHASLADAILFDADLTSADLAGADLTGADLTGANLASANLAGTILTGSKGLFQIRLDQADADPSERPPNLRGAIDDATNKPLVWRGKPPQDNE